MFHWLNKSVYFFIKIVQKKSFGLLNKNMLKPRNQDKLGKEKKIEKTFYNRNNEVMVEKSFFLISCVNIFRFKPIFFIETKKKNAYLKSLNEQLLFLFTIFLWIFYTLTLILHQNHHKSIFICFHFNTFTSFFASYIFITFYPRAYIINYLNTKKNKYFFE